MAEQSDNNTTHEFDLEGFEKDLKKKIVEGRSAFKGLYREHLNELSGLSKEKIDSITPKDITDLQKYDELVTVVKEASRVNLSQAQLKSQIQKLGEVAIKIANLVPSLAKILL